MTVEALPAFREELEREGVPRADDAKALAVHGCDSMGP